MLRHTGPQTRDQPDEPYLDIKQRMLSFLTNTPVGVLSTVTPDGDPHGAGVYYTIDTKFVVSFLTKGDTRKYDNLVHKNRCMLTVFDADTQTTVQMTGRALQVTSEESVYRALRANYRASLATSYGGIPAIEKLEAGEYAVFKIMPVQVRMAVYARPDGGDYTELFETVEGSELD